MVQDYVKTLQNHNKQSNLTPKGPIQIRTKFKVSKRKS